RRHAGDRLARSRRRRGLLRDRPGVHREAPRGAGRPPERRGRLRRCRARPGEGGGAGVSLEPTLRPRVQMIAEPLIDRIIDEAFDVLERLGLQFENPKALDVFADHGQRVEREKERVYLSRDFIEKALKTTPKSITIWNVTGTKSIEVGGD